MVSLSHVEQEPLHKVAAEVQGQFGERMRRAIRRAPLPRAFARTGWLSASRPPGGCSSGCCGSASNDAQPVDTQKRIRLCNINAFGGAVIMAVWAVRRGGVRRSRHLPWELGFVAGFVGVLALNASGAHRAGAPAADRHRERLRTGRRAAVHRTGGRHAAVLRAGGGRRCCCSARRMAAGDAGRAAARGAARRVQDGRRRDTLLVDPAAARARAGTSSPTPPRRSRWRSWCRSSSFVRT